MTDITIFIIFCDALRSTTTPPFQSCLLDYVTPLVYKVFSFLAIIQCCLAKHIRTMTETSEQPSKAADKGKMMLIKNEVINLRDIRPTHTKKTIEVRVYRKWIGRNDEASDEELEEPMKDQPLSADASPTTYTSYHAESDLEEDKEDPEEDPADHPANG
ncbi:hypothetical protein Tco_0698509 [Tanacetum coccineum]